MREMPLQEKLNLISALEECGFHEQAIRDWIYDEEHPEEHTIIKANSREELLEALHADDNDPIDDTEDEYDCDAEGLPLIFTNRKRGLA